MTIFCIQLHPDRAPGMDLDRVHELCKLLASDTDLVIRHGVIEGNDGGPYINLMFETTNAPGFWEEAEETLYGDRTVGAQLKAASMTTCTGEHGWDDYLLLHHYDNKYELDSFS